MSVVGQSLEVAFSHTAGRVRSNPIATRFYGGAKRRDVPRATVSTGKKPTTTNNTGISNSSACVGLNTTCRMPESTTIAKTKTHSPAEAQLR
jgi:hypothetical protein